MQRPSLETGDIEYINGSGSALLARLVGRGRSRLLVGGLLVALVIIGAIGASWIAPWDPNDQDLLASLTPPSWMGGDAHHWLGTDILGRDVFARLLYGARISLLVGFSSVLVGGIVGTALGLIAGYAGGRVDAFIGRIVDIQLAFPPIFVAIAIMAVIGQNLANVILVLSVVTWVQYARVARASTLAVREREFVLAARALGARGVWVVVKHILPNILSPLVVISTVSVSTMIIAEASLSFLGLGVQPPTATWGGMLAENRDVAQIAWWNIVFPGLAILTTVAGVNLIGDALRDRRR